MDERPMGDLRVLAERLLAETSRLRAALAECEKSLLEIRSHMTVAEAQSLPSDCQLIMGHVRDSLMLATTAHRRAWADLSA